MLSRYEAHNTQANSETVNSLQSKVERSKANAEALRTPRSAERKPYLEAEVVELVAAFGDDLVLVDPDVAVAGEDVDVGARFPVGMGLVAVGIAEGDVDAREFFVLQQDADHFRKSEVGAKG